MKDYQGFLSDFGNDQKNILFLNFNESALKKTNLKILDEITRRLEANPDFQGVKSLMNIQFFTAKDNIAAQYVLTDILNDEKNLEDNQYLINQINLLPNWFYFSKTNGAGITFYLKHGANKNFATLDNFISKLVSEYKGKIKRYRLVGTPLLLETFDELILRDQMIFLFSILILILLISKVILKRWSIAIWVFCLQMGLCVILMGLYFYADLKLNLVTGLIIPTVLVVSTGDLLHLLHHNHLSNDTIRYSILRVWKPCLLTTVTTIVSLFGFSISELRPLAMFGLYSSLGVLLAFVLTFTLGPIWVVPYGGKYEARKFNQQISKCVSNIMNLALKYNKAVLSIFLFIVLFSVYGIMQLKSENHVLKFLPNTFELRKHIESLDQEIHGVESLSVVLQRQNKQPLWQADTYKKLTSIRKSLKNKKLIQELYTVDRMSQMVYKKLSLSSKSFDQLSPVEIEQFYFLLGLSKDDLWKSFYSEEGKVHILLKDKWDVSEVVQKKLKEIQKTIRDTFSKTQFYFTGQSYLWLKIDQQILSWQWQSLFFAFVSLFIVFLIYYRSFLLTFLILVPNTLPILLILSVLGILQIKMNMVTLMIAAIVLGINVDNSIHYLNYFLESLRSREDFRTCLQKTNDKISSIMVGLPFFMALGFLSLLFGSLVPAREFSIMMALALLLCLLVEILILPIFLKKYYELASPNI